MTDEHDPDEDAPETQQGASPQQLVIVLTFYPGGMGIHVDEGLSLVDMIGGAELLKQEAIDRLQMLKMQQLQAAQQYQQDIKAVSRGLGKVQ